MEIALAAVILGLGIPIVAILSGPMTRLIEKWMDQRAQLAQMSRGRDWTGEEALFSISAASDLKDLKQRMDRLEEQIAQIAGAVTGGAPGVRRSLDPIEQPTPPEATISQ